MKHNLCYNYIYVCYSIEAEIHKNSEFYKEFIKLNCKRFSSYESKAKT